MNTKRCKTCRKLFSTAKQECYCSEECRKEARKKVRKNWEDKNPNYMSEYMRERRKNTTRSPCSTNADSKKCRICGETVKLNKIYCSPTCRAKGRN